MLAFRVRSAFRWESRSYSLRKLTKPALLLHRTVRHLPRAQHVEAVWREWRLTTLTPRGIGFNALFEKQNRNCRRPPTALLVGAMSNVHEPRSTLGV